MSVALDESATVIEIGGRPLLVGPLRVRHLAALERRTLADRVNPLQRLPEALAGLETRQQEMLLGQVFELLSRGPRVAEGELEAYLDTRAGLLEALWLSAHELEPELEQSELAERFDSLPAQELADLRTRAEAALRLPWGNAAGQADDATSCSPTTGGGSSAALSLAHHWTPVELEALTLEQLRLWQAWRIPLEPIDRSGRLRADRGDRRNRSLRATGE